MPGDPATIALGPRATPEIRARYAEKMHLDQPVLIQLGVFAGQILRGDLGEDLFSGRPVTAIVMADLGRTLILAVAGWAGRPSWALPWAACPRSGRTAGSTGSPA